MANIFEFAALAERFALGVLLLDGTLSLQFANRKGCQVWGYEEPVVFTQEWKAIAKKLALSEKYGALPKNAAPLTEILKLRLSKKTRHLRAEVYPLQHDDCDCYLVLVKDRRLADPLDDIWMLASQVQALSNLASAVAHDLSSAVNNMQLSLRLFETAALKAAGQQGEAYDAELARYARVMREEFGLVANLARDLPQLIKAPEASVSASTDVRQLLKNVERWIRHHAAAKQVRRELSVPKGPALALVNAQKLELVLFNLSIALVDNTQAGDTLSLNLSLQRRTLNVSLRTKETHLAKDVIEISGGLLLAAADGALPLFSARLIVEAQGGELNFSDGGFHIKLPRIFS
jgi:signal transduction histidine kinase